MTAFGDNLRKHLAASKTTVLSFAGKVGHSQGFVSMIMAGKRTAPLDRMDRWCEAMGLRGKEKLLFKDLAAVTHVPHLFRPRAETVVIDWHRSREEAERKPGKRAANPRADYKA
jgi:hypothetical protein